MSGNFYRSDKSGSDGAVCAGEDGAVFPLFEMSLYTAFTHGHVISSGLTGRSRQLLLADHAFRQAKDSLEYCLNARGEVSPSLRETLIAGACAMYRRPFTRGAFLGRLGGIYVRFPGQPEFKSLHEGLCREQSGDGLYANFGKSPFLSDARLDDSTDVEILFQRTTGMLASVRGPTPSPDVLRAVMRLCEFQSQRVRGEFQELLPKLFTKSVEYNRRYKLGVDIPQ